jgi:magnesium chelatase family protein
MNPCPCGKGIMPGACECGAARGARYLRRVSGPFLDRFDLRLVVERPRVDELLGGPPGESTAAVCERIQRARAMATARGIPRNADIPAHRLDDVAPLSAGAAAILRRELELNRLTGRGLHRVRRVARTIADLRGAGPLIDEGLIAGALGMRVDPSTWTQAAAA